MLSRAVGKWGGHMLKSIAGVILGYLAMSVIVFVTLTISYFLLGADRVFQPGTYDVTMFWIALMVLFSVVSAIVGGLVCLKIARKKGAVIVLAVLTLLLGVISAVTTPARASTDVRTGDVSNFQAMMKGKEPVWFVWLLPVIGCAGVLVGGRSTRG